MFGTFNKVCKKCKQNKPLEDFVKNSRNKDGKQSRCKPCLNSDMRQYRHKNIEKYKSARKAHYDKNKNIINEKRKENTKKRSLEKAIYDIEYRNKNSEKIASYKKNWEIKNKNNSEFKIKKNLRRRIHHVLKGYSKTSSTFNLIGCSAAEFKIHIESLWLEGMSWENYGPKGWHIDHIIPCFKFNLLYEEEQKICFHYKNQRPLWAKDNLSRKRNE